MPEQAWHTSVPPGMFAGYTQTCETDGGGVGKAHCNFNGSVG